MVLAAEQQEICEDCCEWGEKNPKPTHKKKKISLLALEYGLKPISVSWLIFKEGAKKSLATTSNKHNTERSRNIV